MAFTSDGSAIVTWSQNRFTSESLPNGYSLSNLLSSQDIWCAIYDKDKNQILYNWSISDSNLNGRGEASVSINSNDIAIVSWIVKNDDNNTHIYSRNVFKNNGIWYQGNENNISDVSDINRNVRMSQFDNGKSLAIWINESNNSKDNRIFMNYYDGSNWGNNQILKDYNPGFKRNDLSVNINDNYGALGWVATLYDSTGKFKYNLNAKFWDVSTGKWIGSKNSLDDYDSVNCVQKPKIAITDNNIAVLSYVMKPMYKDINQNIPSTLYLSLCDIKNNSQYWKKWYYLPDSNVTIWDMDVSVSGNVLYLLTQERDTILGNNYVPKIGLKFGSPDAGLVLRTWRINDDLTFTKIQEPGTPTGINDIPSQVNLELKQNYPNPFSTSTTIEYTIPNDGNIKLEIFDILGEKISTLLNDNLSSGFYQTSFMSDNISSGIYIYKLTYNNMTLTKKMIINK